MAFDISQSGTRNGMKTFPARSVMMETFWQKILSVFYINANGRRKSKLFAVDLFFPVKAFSKLGCGGDLQAPIVHHDSLSNLCLFHLPYVRLKMPLNLISFRIIFKIVLLCGEGKGTKRRSRVMLIVKTFHVIIFSFDVGNDSQKIYGKGWLLNTIIIW